MHPTTFPPIKQLIKLASLSAYFIGRCFTVIKETSRKLHSFFSPTKKMESHNNCYRLNSRSIETQTEINPPSFITTMSSLTTSLKQSLTKRFTLEEKTQVKNLQITLRMCKKQYIKLLGTIVQNNRSLEEANIDTLQKITFEHLTHTMKHKGSPQSSISFLQFYIQKITAQASSLPLCSTSTHASSIQFLIHLHRLEMSLFYLLQLAVQHNLSSRKIECLFEQALMESPFEAQETLLML